MKDLPHHMKKLNRRVIRSIHREEMDEEAYDAGKKDMRRPLTERQVKKQAKEQVKKARNGRASTQMTPEERNKKMAKRVPVFDRLNKAAPKRGAKPTKKKTPRI